MLHPELSAMRVLGALISVLLLFNSASRRDPTLTLDLTFKSKLTMASTALWAVGQSANLASLLRTVATVGDESAVPAESPEHTEPAVPAEASDAARSTVPAESAVQRPDPAEPATDKCGEFKRRLPWLRPPDPQYFKTYYDSDQTDPGFSCVEVDAWMRKKGMIRPKKPAKPKVQRPDPAKPAAVQPKVFVRGLPFLPPADSVRPLLWGEAQGYDVWLAGKIVMSNFASTALLQDASNFRFDWWGTDVYPWLESYHFILLRQALSRSYSLLPFRQLRDSFLSQASARSLTGPASSVERKSAGYHFTSGVSLIIDTGTRNESDLIPCGSQGYYKYTYWATTYEGFLVTPLRVKEERLITWKATKCVVQIRVLRDKEAQTEPNVAASNWQKIINVYAFGLTREQRVSLLVELIRVVPAYKRVEFKELIERERTSRSYTCFDYLRGHYPNWVIADKPYSQDDSSGQQKIPLVPIRVLTRWEDQHLPAHSKLVARYIGSALEGTYVLGKHVTIPDAKGRYAQIGVRDARGQIVPVSVELPNAISGPNELHLSRRE